MVGKIVPGPGNITKTKIDPGLAYSLIFSFVGALGRSGRQRREINYLKNDTVRSHYVRQYKKAEAKEDRRGSLGWPRQAASPSAPIFKLQPLKDRGRKL